MDEDGNTTMPQQLSKTRFVAGCQCYDFLWWKVHEPDAEEFVPDLVLQDRFEQGSEVGELARTPRHRRVVGAGRGSELDRRW